MPTWSHFSSRCARAAKLEIFDGSRDKAEQSIQSIHITVMMQLNMFVDERMTILSSLSFVHGGIVQVWAENETNMILSHSSTYSTLAQPLAGIKRTFRGLDQEKMVHTQLLALKMRTGTIAAKYMAKYEMLSGRTRFNEVALEDAFIRGLPQPIYSKVYSQTSLPLGLDNWKTVMCNLDHLH